MGCWSLPARSGGDATDRTEGSAGLQNPRAGAGRTGGARNIHPTVKPVELMRWLVRLVTPVNGIVLDPFLGSGTTAMAAVYEQRRWIGIEREAEYAEIAERRIASVAPLFAQEVS
jgi:DNA modification methylase